MIRDSRTWIMAAATAAGIGLGGLAAIVGANPRHVVVPHAPPPLASLAGVAVPEPPNLGEFVRDRGAAITLGKAFFWDMQAGSDGVQACASCHFHAGADTRTTRKPADFPFHRLADPNDRTSRVLATSDEVVSSPGIGPRDVRVVGSGAERDGCARHADAIATGTFRGPRRNAPTVINAAFNFRNFWDGRASNVFNGVNAFGRRDPSARVLVRNADGRVTPTTVDFINASAASQAVSPPVDTSEMSCAGRTFQDLGRKLLVLRPLAKQRVDADDSVLGAWRDPSGLGLRVRYAALVERAFQPALWDGAGSFAGYSQMEANFSLFWGLAIQLYEATLVSDRTPFDAFMRGRRAALTADQTAGLELFQGKGRCMLCHAGPELTSAATLLQPQSAAGALVDRMFAADVRPALYDRGFYNIGVAPSANDLGLGAADPFGHPLSFARQAKARARGAATPDAFTLEPQTFTIDPAEPVDRRERDAVDGAFKTPTLRNVELTGPYFHTGAYATLASVIDFYNRGGDRRDSGDRDTSGVGDNPTNAPATIEPLFLTEPEKAAMVAFLKALTDERVRWEQAPFDHPQLFVRNGPALVEIPAVGAGGRAARGLPPLKPFAE